jgi:hypothetical protein
MRAGIMSAPVFDTDKITYHGYFQAYARIAAELGPRSRVCELGVHAGESLRMFAALFPLAEITGVDANAGSNWPTGTTRVVALQDDTALPGILGGQFGLIVDDASHQGDTTRRSFDLLWPLVQPGGYYVIEDWTVALRDDPHWGQQAGWGDGMLRTAESFLPMLAWRDGECESITYRYGLIIIRKNEKQGVASGDTGE